MDSSPDANVCRIRAAWPAAYSSIACSARACLRRCPGRDEVLGVTPDHLAPAAHDRADALVVERPDVVVVEGRVEALGLLAEHRDVERVEALVVGVVVGLVGAAVGGGEADRRERVREVVVDVGVHVEQEVTEAGHRAVVAGAQGDPPGLRDLVLPAGVPGVHGAEVQVREHGVELGQPGAVGEVAGVGRRLHVLGHAQVGEREDRVVVARLRQRGEPVLHLGDHVVDAGGVAVGTHRSVVRRVRDGYGGQHSDHRVERAGVRRDDRQRGREGR